VSRSAASSPISNNINEENFDYDENNDEVK
jgi:hypothetical protein